MDAPDPPINDLKQRPIGRILVKMGKLSRDQVAEVLKLQKSRPGTLLGQMCIELGFVKELDVVIGIAAQCGCSITALYALFGKPATCDALKNLKGRQPFPDNAAGATCPN